MEIKKVEPDEHLIAAGKCFMFLCWVESYMRDLLVLQEGGEYMRKKYNEAFGCDNHPACFAKKRLELGKCSFEKIKTQLLCKWPQWKEHSNVHESIERAVIFRNGFGHANVQFFRPFLLYTPNSKSQESINNYMKCPKCLKNYKSCKCSGNDEAKPRTLIFRCLDKEFRKTFYGDIETIDLE